MMRLGVYICALVVVDWGVGCRVWGLRVSGFVYSEGVVELRGGVEGAGCSVMMM